MTKKKENKFDPRPYMQLAIEEMNKSLNEPRADGKVPPKVGAILLFPDGTVIRAHRGELRDGDHAEYTLLERKLGGKKLDQCILFSTLEPCVTRNSPKLGCCKRTVKARIKTVYVGITDPDPTVSGKGIEYMEQHDAHVFMFDRDLQKDIEEENVNFLKQALERKMKQEKKESLSILEQPQLDADFSRFSKDALKKFIVGANLNFDVNSQDFKDYLVDIRILQIDKRNEKYIPTGTGILLFGKNPRGKFPQAVLKAHVDYGGNKIEPKDFDQPLVLIPDLIEEWLKKVLPLSKDTSSFKRKDVPDFPIAVLREAIINAVVHRDYSIEGAKSSIEIDNDKILVKSPGAPLPSISLEQLNTFKAPSISRNPLITFVFSLMDYVEEKGFGMKTLKSLYDKYGLPLPEYSFSAPFLELTFPRNIDAVKKISKFANIGELNDEELRGLEWIKLMEEVSTREYSANFNYGYKKAQRHVAKMKELGLVGDNGEAVNSPNYRYVVLKDKQ